MLHILPTAVRQIIHAFALVIENSQNTDVQQDYLSKKEDIFGHCFRFPSFCFLEEKPPDFICAS